MSERLPDLLRAQGVLLDLDGVLTPSRPIDFGDEQKLRYRGRNVAERSFNKLKQWRGIAMRSDKSARSYRAAISLATTLIWIKSDLINTA